MSKATISFDLSNDEDNFNYKCAMVGFEACMLLESLKHLVDQYDKHDIRTDIVFTEMVSQLREWKVVK